MRAIAPCRPTHRDFDTMPTNRPSRRRMAARRPLHATALTLALAGAAHTSAASAADASGTAAP
ncbi:hypothetical protein KTF56_34695, partial [Burkholderia gladioli]|uniref:hypothetical protein n=1 Tax=Burkholderia gladioli TaxID=28095 RepID=UPI001C220890